MKLRSRRQSYLPDHLIVEIIRKLPVKYILRFRSVNKSWYRFISTSSFIKSTISNTNNNDNYLLYTHYDHYILKDLSEEEEDKFNRLKYYYTPQLFGINTPQSFGINKIVYPYNHKVKVYGVCNGLLCVSDSNLHVKGSIYLWNPIIRKAKKISMIRPAVGEVHDVDLCFGYFRDDYKVIRIASYRGGKYRVGVYSLSTDAWKVTYCGGDSDSHFLICNPSSNKFVGGVAYFGVAHFAKFTCKLLCFDLHHRRIGEVQFPDKFGSQLDPHSRKPLDPFYVERWGESIALIQIMQGHLTMWILRKGATTNTSTWDNIVTINLETHVYIHPLGFTKHGQYLLRDNVGGEYLWDLGISQLEDLGISRLEDLWASAVDYLLGNLVLLDEETLDPYVEMDHCSTQTTCVLYRSPSPRNKKRPYVG